MRDESTKAVLELIKKDRNVIAVTADNRNEYYNKARINFPNQYIDYGISESNMIGSSAGLASIGKIPFLYTVTNFMAMRTYEFIRNLICFPNYNVKFLGRSAGLVSGNMGMTHQGTEDLTILRALPNLLVITPASPIEARQATYEAYRYKGPVYIRLEGKNEPELYDETYQFKIGKGNIIRLGNHITLISIGSIVNIAIEAAEILKREFNISMRIINMPTIKPIDKLLILEAMKETSAIITLEEHSIYGGLGSAVAEILAENSCSVQFQRMGLNDFCKGSGTHNEVRNMNGLSAFSIVENVRRLLRVD